MNKITDWVKPHQLIAFFLITFTISWGLGFSYYAINNPGGVVPAWLVNLVVSIGPRQTFENLVRFVE